jgi:hypothetical protein
MGAFGSKTWGCQFGWYKSKVEKTAKYCELESMFIYSMSLEYWDIVRGNYLEATGTVRTRWWRSFAFDQMHAMFSEGHRLSRLLVPSTASI